MKNLISKEQAKSLNQVWYFTGKPCKNNHICNKYVSTGVCYQCKRDNMNKDYLRNTERVCKTNNKSYNKNKEKRIKNSLNWASNNREKSNFIKNKSKLKNIHKVRKQACEYQKIKRQDNSTRLSKNLSKAIWNCLKARKNKQSWKNLVDFTLEELVSHLQNRFSKEMTWENYGSYWHVDHIKPLSWFNLDKEFKLAWSLDNLQPLEASINYSKCNRYAG
jgi:hypothetical protein